MPSAKPKGFAGNWNTRAHGPRMQAKVISCLLEKIDFYESLQHDYPISRLFVQCEQEFGVCRTTVREWWNSFELYGELPYETREHMKRVQKKYKWLPEGAKINETELHQLKGIIDRRPDLYLDEIALLFGIETGKYVHHTTLWRYVTVHLNYSLQCLTERAMQQSEAERSDFKHSLELLLQDNPEMLVMVDETHKDRNAARRRRGYGKKNDGGLKLNQWFKNTVRYTLIGVADINGFVDGACNTYLRSDISDEGAAGTITKEVFEDWVKDFLCPVLGDYSKGEPRSVVLLDNASTHNSNRVVRMIEETGAVVIFSAPFSPDLNPIENFFSLYKKYLKRNNDEMLENWELVHQRALGCVDRDAGIRYFRRCGISCADKVKTLDEIEKENLFVLFLSTIGCVLLLNQRMNKCM